MGVGILGVQLHRALERRQRLVVEPAIVEDLAHVEVDDGARGVHRERALEPVLRTIEVAKVRQGKAEVGREAHLRRDVFGRDLHDLLEAALELFSERGYAGATTREIAQRADTNEALLFRHFTSKAQLFERVHVGPEDGRTEAVAARAPVARARAHRFQSRPDAPGTV